MYNTTGSQIEKLNELYCEFFKGKRNGIFVEVGANDGVSCSNTYCLAEYDWAGYYIEPINSIYNECCNNHKDHNCIKVFNCAIGSYEGEIDIYCRGALSTTSLEAMNITIANNFFPPQDPVPVQKCRSMRLDTFLKQQNIQPGFDLLVVDTEGTEEDVFNSFDLSYYLPTMVIVELEDDHCKYRNALEKIQEIKRLRDRIISNGYKQVYKDTINTVYVLSTACLLHG